MGKKLGRGMRAATALLLLVALSAGMPVVCFAAAHIELETPFAPCCSHRAGSAQPHGVWMEAASPGCGDCDDVPLASATSHVVHTAACELATPLTSPVTAIAHTANSPGLTVFEFCSLPLRC